MKDENLNKSDWIRAALDRYEHPLLRYAMRYTRDAETARDVVQDTFLQLCRADMDKVAGHLAQWLYTVCRNRAIDVQRKDARMTTLSEAQAENCPSPTPGPGINAARKEEHTMVLDVLKTLPEKQQEAFRLKFQDQMTYREISQIMGKSLGTVNNLITKALTTIRIELQDKTDLVQEVRS